MSFAAKLQLNGSDDDYNVLKMSYSIDQAFTARHRPNGSPTNSTLNITIETSRNSNITEWMLSPTSSKTGKIIFYRRDVGAAMKTIDFEEAYCVHLEETFDSTDDSPMQTTIHIAVAPENLSLNGARVNSAGQIAAALGRTVLTTVLTAGTALAAEAMTNAMEGKSEEDIRDAVRDKTGDLSGDTLDHGGDAGTEAITSFIP
jgi:hypothetical protein